MRSFERNRISIKRIAVTVLLASLVLLAGRLWSSDQFDLVSGILESPLFKDKSPLEKLTVAAELLRTNKLKHSDMSFLLLDWADQYLREPSDPLERLQRWAALTGDDKFGHLRMPRDFLNRSLLAEYLVEQTQYLKMKPYEKLQLLGKLENDKLVDWSVALAYARIYAGGIMMGAKEYKNTSPLEALRILKDLKDQGLIGWHYVVPTEGILISEALALDPEYQKASPTARLAKLADLEKKGLISTLTRKELEKLPVWRLLVSDPSFLKAGPKAKKQKIAKLAADGLISSSTATDLAAIFGPTPLVSPMESSPTRLPKKSSPK